MTAVSSSSLSSSKNNKKIVWFWQSNQNPWDENEEKEWSRYSDFENDFVEEAFQRKEKNVQLNDYIIDFKHNIQLRKNNRHRQRPVKREKVNLDQYVREERFLYPERAVKSFERWSSGKPNLIGQWCEKNADITEWLNMNYSAILELAAQGILKEGKLINQEFDAQRMADQLRSVTIHKYDIDECVARLYSAESFLYKLVNATLRNNDMSKVDTLGPFCYLLCDGLLDRQTGEEEYLYRGANLTEEMIEEYKQAVATQIVWPAFTSTSKDRQVAEQFGNTLFIFLMKISTGLRSWIDISSISHYPNEQEVLISAGHEFRVNKIECDSKSEKYFIYMSGT